MVNAASTAASYWLILARVQSQRPCANFLVISQARIMQALLQHKYFSGLCSADQHHPALSVSLIWSSLGSDLGPSLHQGVPNVRVYVISGLGNQIMDHEFHCALSPGAGVKVS